MRKTKLERLRQVAIDLLIGIIFAGGGAYAATTYSINSNNVQYKDNYNLGSTTVQAAIDGTCTKIDTRLDSIESNVITLDKIYPVGSIYISTSLETADKVTDALGGTWESYGQGRTLVGVGSNGTSTYISNSTGGVEKVSTTLSEDNLPSHTHTISHTHSTSGTTTSTLSLTAETNGAHTHKLISSVSASTGFGVASGSGVDDGYNYGFIDNTTSTVSTFSAASNGAHAHKVSGSVTIPALKTSSISTTTSGSKGSDKAFETSTMQPYIVVYMYRRTS